MQPEDRKLVWAVTVVCAVVSVELAWFLFIGPAKGSPACGTSNTPQCDLPWWDSAAFWTAAFTFFLTVSTGLLWWQTRRLAEGAETQAKDIKAQILATERLAEAARKSADVAELSLVALERPYMFIKSGVFLGKNKCIPFSVVNHGKTPGVIKEVWAKMVYGNAAPNPTDGMGNATSWRLGQPLGNGEKTEELLWSFEEDWATDLPSLTFAMKDWRGNTTHIPTNLPDGMDLYFWVQVKYVGTGEKPEYMTANVWKMRLESGVFLQFPGSSYQS